jgi:hypothetical protein
MAFNFDHTASGDMTFVGGHSAFVGEFIFPKPANMAQEGMLMVGGGLFSIEAISGLQAELNLKVPTGEFKSVGCKNAENSANSIPLLVSDGTGGGLLAVSTIPASIQNSIFVSPTINGLTNLTSANKGDFATVTENSSTYVLTGSSFGNSANWLQLQNADLTILSVNGYTGCVQISGNDLVLTCGQYNGCTADQAVDCLYSCLVDDVNDLQANYVTYTSFDAPAGTIGCYMKTCDFTTNCLDVQYLTTGFVSDCLACYETTAAFTGTIVDYVPYAEVDETAYRNTGLLSGEVVVVGDGGVIDKSLIPSYNYNDTFEISSSGELASLLTGEVVHLGDFAINTVEPATYIYTTGGWVQFVDDHGAIYFVNGHSADGFSSVTIDSSDIHYCQSQNTHLSECISAIVSGIQAVEGDVKSCAEFTGERAHYTLTSVFNCIAATKSATGHGHAMSDISGLSACIDPMKAFVQGDLINLACSYSLMLDPNSATTVSGALVLGQNGKAQNQHFSVVNSAGCFAENGDAQTVKFVGKGNFTSSSFNDIALVPVDQYTAAFVSAEVIGRSSDDSESAAYSIQGLFARESGNLNKVGCESVTTFATTDSGYGVEFITTNDYDVHLRVKGSASTEMHWVANVNYVKLTDSSNGGGGGGVGAYFSGANDAWYTLSNNWYVNSLMTNQATSLPSSDTNVVMKGVTGALVDLSDPAWVQPASIDTTEVTDSNGICFVSGTFSGTIYGNATFLNGAIFG